MSTDAQEHIIKPRPAAKKNPVSKTCLAFPRKLWTEIRIQAIHRGTTAQQLVIDAAREYLGSSRKSKAA